MKQERLYYIDWLRVAVILSLVLYHSALTYTGLGDIYIRTPVKDLRVLPFLIISAPLDNFFMSLLFFLSGVASFYSLQHRSRMEYLKERIKKVLIPFILGTIFICPLQAYFKGIYNGFSGSYLAFIPEFFSLKIVDYLGYAHLWFLLYLFIFSLICAPVFSNWLIDKRRLERISSVGIPIAFIILVETLLRPFFPGKQILIMDWANDIVYLSLFIFGFIFASNTRIQERLDAFTSLSIAIVPACILTFIYIDYLWIVHGSTAVYLSFLWAFTKGIYECFAIILLIGIGKRYFNRKGPTLSYLNNASFTFYIMHFLPVSALTYFIIKTNLNIYMKYISVVVLSYAFLFVLYELVVRRAFREIRKIRGVSNGV